MLDHTFTKKKGVSEGVELRCITIELLNSAAMHIMIYYMGNLKVIDTINLKYI